jgi:DNA-directed RNA polymerase subunit H (RpoH/RPB5)
MEFIQISQHFLRGLLMAMIKLGHTNVPIFTHNCQIKHKLTNIILENENQMNLFSQELVQHLQLPTIPHPDPYQLGLVQREGPCITISWCCTLTFSIGPSMTLWSMMFYLYIVMTSC